MRAFVTLFLLVAIYESDGSGIANEGPLIRPLTIFANPPISLCFQLLGSVNFDPLDFQFEWPWIVVTELNSHSCYVAGIKLLIRKNSASPCRQELFNWQRHFDPFVLLGLERLPVRVSADAPRHIETEFVITTVTTNSDHK